MLTRRPGLTIVELLVIVIVIFLLVPLCIPGGVGGRERARHATCMNNVRQLAKAQQFCIERDRSAAFSGFLQPRSELRSGKQAARSASDETFVAWPTRILPHLEQIELHEAIVENRDGGGFADGVPPFIEVFQCPSDPQVDPSVPALSDVANSGMPDLISPS